MVEVVDMDTGQVYRSPDGKQWAGLEGGFSNLETASAGLAEAGEKLRRVRSKLNAAQRDVAEASCMTHTTLGDIENGVAVGDRHVPRVKLALMRIAAQRLKATAEAIEELVS